MNRILRSLAVIAIVAVVVGTRAARADGPPVNGAFTVTLAIAPGQGSCAGNLAVEARGLGQTEQGPMFLVVKKCFFTGTKTYAGTFALCPSDESCSADSDNAISGLYDGAGQANLTDQSAFPGVIFTPFHGTLTITRDNRHNGAASGTIEFTAVSGRLSTMLWGTAYYAMRQTPQR